MKWRLDSHFNTDENERIHRYVEANSKEEALHKFLTWAGMDGEQEGPEVEAASYSWVRDGTPHIEAQFYWVATFENFVIRVERVSQIIR